MDFRNPISDEAVSGTWSGTAGSRWSLVDDYPDTLPNDSLRSAVGNITFGFSSFNIPQGSTAISVQVAYYDRDVSSGNNNLGGRLKVGGSYFNSATHNPTTTLTSRSDNWAVNPKTGLAWTVDDINGVSGSPLQAFGLNTTDSTPQIDISSIQIQVTYSPPTNSGKFSWIEFETPDALVLNRYGLISWIEFQTDTPPRQGRLSWLELETATPPRRGRVSWIEFQAPTIDRLGKLSWVELQTNSAPRYGKVSHIEFELPEFDRHGRVSFIELQTPSFITSPVEMYIYTPDGWARII